MAGVLRVPWPQMLMDLGPAVYCEDFEAHFLAKAAEFYQVRLGPSASAHRHREHVWAYSHPLLHSAPLSWG